MSELLSLFTAVPIEHTFKIVNFANQNNKSYNYYYVSPKKDFELRMFPDETLPFYGSNNIVLFLSSSEYNQVYYRISLINEKGEKCYAQEGRAYFGYVQKFSGYRLLNFGGQFNIKRTFLLDKINGLLPDGTLTVHCELFKIDPQTVATGYNRDNLLSLSKNYQTLLDSGKMSDVVMVVGGEEFRAHKLILTSQSAVFGAMFEHDLEESKQNRVEITDMSAEAFKDLLQFIYTGKVTALDENACVLLAAADKYQIESLKSFCQHYLTHTLSIKSAPNVLQLAELYNLEELKGKCIDYVSQHSTEFKFDDWKELTTSRPELAFKLFQILGNKLKVKS